VKCDRPACGGEPLWHVPGHPRNFRPSANTAETCENRRLPGTTQRDPFTLGLRFVYTRLIELHRAGLFAGAACFHAFRPYSRFEEIRGVARHVPKRLASRRWATAHHMNAPSLSRTTTRTITRSKEQI